MIQFLRQISVPCLFAGAVLSTPVQAQNYPEKSITMIVPFAAGGGSDVIGRIIADEMSRILGQTIIIENVPGAGGSTALNRASKAAPDGYTILIGNTGTNAAVYKLYTKELQFTPDSFTAVGLVAKTSPVIALKNDFPAKTVAEFVAYTKANAGKVTFGHAGIGSSNYLICLSFLRASGADVTLLGYRGAGPALNDLIGGHIDGVCDNATSISGTINGGKAKGLVISGKTRLKNLPDVATSEESGIGGFQAVGWNMIFVPRGTPEPIVQKLHGAIQQAFKEEKLNARFEALSSSLPNADERSQQSAISLVASEIEKYNELLK